MYPQTMGSSDRRAVKVTDNDDAEDVPLHHLRPFGTGLYKQQIKFVPASDGDLDSTSSTTTKSNKPKLDVAGLYLDMVLANKDKNKNNEKQNGNQSTVTDITTTTTFTTTTTTSDTIQTTTMPTEQPPIVLPQQEICQICSLPYAPNPESKAIHEQSFAHQSRLPHSHPPSALDRSRMGLKHLTSHGWDPDSRQGLGSAAQGIQFPIKGKKKDDHLGLGVEVPKNGQLPVLPKKKEKLLDAKKVRKMAEVEKKKAERIQRELWGRGPDLERYLGKGG
ncbi:hypothetical protein GE21DRAFT_5882 [Neurospora crassa]|uniref:G-patch domain-containing protein n=1 Tax=Neurospora crassa (strain ATCC 24698 / 74-OR23-1A / CBS 708.71 / DSM 1257 / FGSC 987) TaxID=367110 RepID=Q7S9T8_NEUCR|nr:hypothetical protein NCU06368 [Neurospora crassa OR74A]EAA33166.2 hypothetical protein NCU06368 [Neurospora crassa OR74A]KHE85551.1 hypothetical protein GE21DRAFT_5882 [Neurospora crassa]|eukprot:XP_962402.2 hypothetical protein NCU06368 [Neurospora crassa OR74A]